MPETGIVKKIHKWKPFTVRPVGRPKCRWEDDVRNGLKKMKLIKWTEEVQDRLKWKGIVEKAKSVPEKKKKKKKKKEEEKKKKKKEKEEKEEEGGWGGGGEEKGGEEKGGGGGE